MNRESKLHGNLICTDCENLIKALNGEILSFNGMVLALNNFSENNYEGDSAKTLNEKSLELASIIEKMMEGDRKVIQDLKALKEKVKDIYIDGSDVLDNMETAERGARECFDKAISLENAADKAEFIWEADYLRGLANESRSQGETWKQLYLYWEGQAELFDTIDEETSLLFAEGITYHRQARTMMDSFLQCRLTKPSITHKGKITTGLSSKIKENEDEIYRFSYEYLLRNGFTEEQIEYLYKTKPELFSSLYATAHYSTDNCAAIIQNIKDELDKVKEKYYFVIEDIKNKWGISEDEAFKILFKLDKFHRLESLYGTYYSSKKDYNILLESLENKCDMWVKDHKVVLNYCSFSSKWSEEEKELTLKIYFWKYILLLRKP